MESHVKQCDYGTGLNNREDQNRMNQHFAALSSAELSTTMGGDWDWGDFFGGAAWSLGVGCGITGHPVLCFGAASFAGLTLYF